MRPGCADERGSPSAAAARPWPRPWPRPRQRGGRRGGALPGEAAGGGQEAAGQRHPADRRAVAADQGAARWAARRRRSRGDAPRAVLAAAAVHRRRRLVERLLRWVRAGLRLVVTEAAEVAEVVGCAAAGACGRRRAPRQPHPGREDRGSPASADTHGRGGGGCQRRRRRNEPVRRNAGLLCAPSARRGLRARRRIAEGGSKTGRGQGRRRVTRCTVVCC